MILLTERATKLKEGNVTDICIPVVFLDKAAEDRLHKSERMDQELFLFI